jgi:methylglutaconyl-CoA hydratase
LDAGFTTEIDGGGVATLTLDRPEAHNALDERAIAALTEQFARWGAEAAVRAVVVAARGAIFCAGADVGWMRRAAAFSEAENVADAVALAELLRVLDTLPKPTVAAVQGPAYGGGVGLIACCDIALAVRRARFQFSEVKLGLIPAVIAPYAIAAIGAREARRYFLTAEPMGAEDALRLGLVHQVVDDAAALEVARARVVGALAAAPPGALAEAKALIAALAGRPIDGPAIALTARRIAARRANPEAREGLSAFLEKRPPSWAK